MNYKILAVDDNPINLKLLSKALVNSNYQILTADSGQEAFKLAVSEKPDIILLDVMMPEMDGYEVCKKLREREDTRYIPVIFLSAKNESTDKARGLALGAVDYLTKPFDTMEINARVRNHLTANQKITELLRKNEELQESLKNISTAQNETRLSELKFVDKINQTTFNIENEYMKLYADSKSSSEPVTGIFFPFMPNEKQLVYALLSGFKKNYPTLIVQLMLEKYIEGFILAQKDNLITNEIIQQLVMEILEKFSPDIYDVAVAFSIGFINFNDRNIYLYSVRQANPYLINQYKDSAFLDGQALDFNPKYAKIIKAVNTELEEKSILCYHRKGLHDIPEEVYKERFLKTFEENDYQLQESIQKISKNLPSEENDQIIAAIQIK